MSEQENDTCRDCGAEEAYFTSQCNFAHCVECGAAWDEDHDECSADPCMIACERAGKTDEALRIQRRGCRFGEDHDPREHDVVEKEEGV